MEEVKIRNLEQREEIIITSEDVKKHPLVIATIEKSDKILGILGYTEHGLRHTSLVSNIAYNIMRRLGRDEKRSQLAAIAGVMHDMGNVVNRYYHAQTAALMAQNILMDLGMPYDDILDIIGAIGNHDEKDGFPISDICAALILADKSDVHSSRVRNPDSVKFDIHDRVNYAAKSSFLRVDDEKKTISLEIKIDTKISSPMEYFEIFLSRMVVCRRAAEFLGMRFELSINGHRLL
ncbi:MAG: phosphohydrolase [candidate division Zixibacteria bacterium CG_4_9_14_3_um_filter_46_8]|nr:MAG: phosphohydrolase [candidate division Zixibacteria bacterium CG_4_9_14_3_um_filter_46_8]